MTAGWLNPANASAAGTSPASTEASNAAAATMSCRQRPRKEHRHCRCQNEEEQQLVTGHAVAFVVIGCRCGRALSVAHTEAA
jgi:hypothetical protein